MIHFKQKITGLLVVIIYVTQHVYSQQIPADSSGAAMKKLGEFRATLKGKTDAASVKKMLGTGMWREALTIIESNQKSIEFKLLKADYLVLQNDFAAAEKKVTEVLNDDPANEKAVELHAFLAIQAWELQKAENICRTYLATSKSEKINLMLGRSLLLQKRYPDALAIAKLLQNRNPANAGSYLLEADVYFWNQQPDKAEAPLKKSLALDPFNADARFSYGYAIWRRIDATQLDAMAAQWEIALAVNPLHYQTHWHWGNGHTNLTYADYAAKDDDSVRTALKPVDDLFKKADITGAIAATIAVEKKFPSSVLPLLHRASVYYSAFEMDRELRLDSSQDLFLRMLNMVKHYGPAHNGLSAVIKSRRIPYLRAYDSIMQSLRSTPIADMENFTRVFPDVAYYPGQLAKAMVWNQLFTSIVYFPFLSKQGNSFRIPPLHIDLAIAMGQPSFRFMTTFDNRQWMDIRGVGSGAAAIEYVERGAFLERNVILHEYVHLFHGRVLTDEENRQIRSHYYKAMKEKRTLDYYSQNNESEYFAQTYPAYFEPVKVHPLDFKSMNTTSDLRKKDPGMYEFLDKLVKKERAYLEGDKKAMAGNWAQTYQNLAMRSRNMNAETAARFLDTALQYDPVYLPVYVAYAQLYSDQEQYDSALSWLAKGKKIKPDFAPLYAAEARITGAMKDSIGNEVAIVKQVELYRKALSLEKDYQELASMNIQFRDMYRRNGLMAESVEVAEAYARSGSVISTYLRDRRDDAIAYASSTRAILGYPEHIAVLKKLVEQKPQNFEYRNLYADALSVHGRNGEAIATIRQAQRILSASGNARADYALRLAEYYSLAGNADSASVYLAPFLAGRMRPGNEQLRYIRLLAKSGKISLADSLLAKVPLKGDDITLAQVAFTKAVVFDVKENKTEATRHYEMAISKNKYLPEAYHALLRLHKERNDKSKTDLVKAGMNALKLKPGPLFRR